MFDVKLDTGAALDQGISTLCDQISARPIVRANGQAELCREIELAHVAEVWQVSRLLV